MAVKIKAIKYESVNGKRRPIKIESFPMDAKKMAKYKTEASVKRQIEDYMVKNRHFKREELSDVKIDMGEFLEEWRRQKKIVEVETLQKLQESPNNPASRITPEKITRLTENEIFVFGSNAQGQHHGGAAKIAVERFGAVMGQGHGMQGKCYAINSMSGLSDMTEDINRFCEFARTNPGKHFFVTRIGCGIAGYRDEEIAPLFANCKDLTNVSLPATFWKTIGHPQTKEFPLGRFVDAQRDNYERALNEINNGRKVSHWIWYIFPQLRGLGHSHNSEFYGLESIEEAAAYWAHPVLGARLREISEALLTHKGKKNIDQIMGSRIDVIKLQTCMNLFNRIAPNDIFKEVLDAFFKRNE